jgi:muconolactone D-isomerase
MEFLVEFEVDIPPGTPDADVDDREAAEASAAARLVEQGHLVRLWSLPKAAGKTNNVGLYQADSPGQLDGLLDALPLRDWLTVTVTRLDPHPNDPMAATGATRPAGPPPLEKAFRTEYLVTMTTHVPDGTAAEAVDAIRTRESARASELAGQGHLLRLWRPPLQPGEWRSIGLFAAEDGDQLEQALASMPLRVWRTDEVRPLLPHPNDPAAARG